MLTQPQLKIRSPGPVVFGFALGIPDGLPIGEDEPDAASSEQLPPDTPHKKIGGGHHTFFIPGLNRQKAHLKTVNLSREASPGPNRNLQSVFNPDPTAEEKIHLSGRSKSEGAGVLQKKVPFLRKKEWEAGQIDLLVIDFDLGEVGVDGDIQGHGRVDSVFDVETNIVPEVGVRDREVPLNTGQNVGDELQITDGLNIQRFQVSRQGQPVDIDRLGGSPTRRSAHFCAGCCA